MNIGQIGAASKPAGWSEAPGIAHVGSPNTAPNPAAAVITENAVTATQQTAAGAPVGQALQSINSFLESVSSSLQFSLDQDSKRVIVKVVDKETNDVIRQIPSEEAIEISKALDKLQGLLVNSQA
ncbi:flagellar protein FlaG [uncultured Oxalicibacterium sp.]|uniref:flagellar protein FlaG n=1 Tax=uncultured Oxalicibacterium sp. TaxID=1168540 RepID=UPI0025FBE575|nr:flagellar protein FlaG [uncultured Oxalicibacterium sp.]